MKRKVAPLIALLFLSSWLLVSCSDAIQDVRKNITDLAGKLRGDADNREPQVLNLVENAEPVNLDTATLIDDSSVKIMTNVMEGLMRLDEHNQAKPAMAADFPKVSKDKKTYIFKLREAQWSDGKPVRAQDFEYAWKRALDPRTRSEYAYILYPILNAKKYNSGQAPESEVGVKALDNRTLQVKLEEPIPYFLSLTAFITYLPQRKDIVEKYGDQYAKDVDKMVFNGPFVLSEWKHEQSYQYRKNPQYWDKDHVFLAEVNVKIATDSATMLNLYNANQVDVTPLDSHFVDAFKNSKEFHSVNSGTIYFMRFNTQNTFLSNPKIRKAFSLAIDREELVQEVLKDDTPAGAMVPPSVMGYNDYFRNLAKEPVKHDPTQAQALLEKGMRELNIDTLPTLELLVYDDDRKKSAVMLKDQIKATLGIDVQVNPMPPKQKFEREKQGLFQLAIQRWTGDYNDPMTFLDMWHSTNEMNFGRWNHSRFDALINKSKLNLHYGEREKDLIEAEKILLDEAAAAPLYYEREAYLQKPHVKNLVRHPVGAKYTLKWVKIQGKTQQ